MELPAHLRRCLDVALEWHGQDVLFKIGAVPRAKVGNTLKPLPFPKSTVEDMTSVTDALLNENQKRLLEKNHSVDFAFTFPGTDQRFRGNIFFQQGHYSLVLRRLWKEVPSFESLHIPPVLKKVALEQSGLILIAGTVGSGKTTTINAMINHMNHTITKHIVTIEDPVEYLHDDDQCMINQREIGQDTPDFTSALKYVVRQSPDVILIGEMRDAETFNFALSASEVGRLVISTIHAKSVQQIFDRILGFFPNEQRAGVLGHLCFHIRCFLTQKLLVGKDGKTLFPAFEILIGNEIIRDLVRERNFDKIPQALRNATHEGMQTMDQAIYQLWEDGKISNAEALGASEKPQELNKLLKGIQIDGHRAKILGN